MQQCGCNLLRFAMSLARVPATLLEQINKSLNKCFKMSYSATAINASLLLVPYLLPNAIKDMPSDSY